jgi:hypothetical protein
MTLSVLAYPIVSSAMDLQLHSGIEEQGPHGSRTPAHHSGPTAAIENLLEPARTSIVTGQPCRNEIAIVVEFWYEGVLCGVQLRDRKGKPHQRVVASVAARGKLPEPRCHFLHRLR